ncbi:tetratricopeptide repeat protein [Novilysobacter erysipheiresistens]|uniref:Tetratricopeptide repeat protein n=1 Tax=Novilysobacter erysipheiresistens TaxID=1749332 RepID=A0ABU7YU48_9GAMM
MNPNGDTGRQEPAPTSYRFGGVVVDTAAHTLTRDGQPQAIEPKAFAVLLVLLRHADELVPRDELLDAVWGHRHVTPGVLTRAIAQLRAALDDHPHEPRFIQTQHALGYRFIGELKAAPETALVEPEPAPVPDSPSVADAILPTASVRVESDPVPIAAAASVPEVAPAEVVAADPQAARPRTARRRRIAMKRTWLAAAVALVVVALVALGWYNRRAQPPAPAEASIAVLPFTNLSDNRDDRYFAEGLAVEMHDALASIPGLKVASVPGDPADAEASPDIKALGRRLGVATVLDASVRREGDRLRVNARLSDTDTGFTLWSESYDREADDVFAVQSEIANQVVQALPGVLTVHRRTYRRLWPTQDLSAYEAYLKGQQQLLEQPSDNYLDKAIGFFGEALAADAGFARAQAGICRAEIIRFEGARDALAFQRAQEACTRAAQMDPELREVSLALGEMHRVRGDYALANEHYTLALDDLGLRPAAYVGLARVQSEQGQDQLALEYFELARRLRPGDALVYRELGYHQYMNGDVEAAIESFRTATTLQPDDAGVWSSLGGLYFVADDNARAADAFQRSLAIKPSYAALSNLGTLRYAQGAYVDAAKLYRRAAELDPTDFRIWGNLGDALAALPETAGQTRQPYQRAAQLAGDYVAIKAEDAQAHALLGFYRASLGERDAALEHLRKAEALGTEVGEVSFFNAQTLTLLGDAGGARNRLQRAREAGIPAQRIDASPVLRRLTAAGATAAAPPRGNAI